MLMNVLRRGEYINLEICKEYARRRHENRVIAKLSSEDLNLSPEDLNLLLTLDNFLLGVMHYPGENNFAQSTKP